MNDKVYKSFYLFLLNLGIVSLVLFVLHKLSLLRVDLIFNESWLFAILIFSFTFCIAVKDKLNRSRYLTNRNIETIFEVSPYFFLSILIILAVNQFLKLDFLISRNFHIVVLGIAFGFLAFYRNRDRIENELEDEKKKEEEKERDRANDFEYKFPGINRIWGIRSIVKWMYKEGWSFSIPFVIIALVFIGIKIGMPLFSNGSYIDEYLHIFSGIELFKTGNFAEIYPGTYYNRGQITSFFVGLFIFFLGKKIFFAKLIPITLGIINFFLLYNISKKFIPSKMAKVSLLVLYSISPWVIFNHLYIRMSVFHEFFFLITSLYLYKINYSLNHLKIKEAYFYLVVTVLLITINIIFGNDFVGYLVASYVLIGLGHIIFKLKKSASNLEKRVLPRTIYFLTKYRLLIFLFSIGIISLTFYGFNIMSYFENYKLTYGNTSNIKYNQLFFNLNLPFTIPFIISFLCSFFKKNENNSPIIFSSGLLFLILNLIPLKFQVIRGIFFFLPIFYLISLYLIYGANFGKFFRYLFLIILVITLINNYPDRFIKNPWIPNEINFIDNNLFIDSANYCKNKTTIIAGTPGIAIFYGLRPDYQINYKYEEVNNSYYDFGSKESYDVYTKTKLIVNETQFQKIYLSNNEICYIEASVPNEWVSKETRNFVYSNFINFGNYSQTSNTVNTKLFIK